MKKNVIVMAAGKSRRMKSKTSKVLHTILGKTVIDYVLDLADGMQSDNTVVVISPHQEDLKERVEARGLRTAIQQHQRGTGDAAAAALPYLEEGSVLILCGDAPCFREESLVEFHEFHQAQGNQLSILSVKSKNPFGYGRILRKADRVVGIREEQDASEEERSIDEINSGVYLLDKKTLEEFLPRLDHDNSQGEIYITDLVELVSQEGKVGAFCIDDEEEITGINTRLQLQQATRILQGRINEAWMASGVTMLAPESIFIDAEVELSSDVTLLPGTILQGKTLVEEDAIIGPYTVLKDMIIRRGAEVMQSTLLSSEIGEETKVGPFAYVRPGSVVGAHCKVGDFVEIKNANIGDSTKISHLSYVGDSDLEDHINIGCGVVFVNYDGIRKHRSFVGSGAFIGCNTNVVSPVRIESGAYVAAGTTVTEDVPAQALAIGRSRQTIKEKWATGKIKKK